MIDRSCKIVYFGYGSLVNPEARSTTAVSVPGRITGWIRQWSHCVEADFGNVCALTVARRPGVTLQGIFAFDDPSNVEAVDRREIGYRRWKLNWKEDQLSLEMPVGMCAADAYLYVSTTSCYRWGNAEFPILQSYLDCVLAGYLREFGRTGVVDFLQTTEGWNTPILNDRGQPKYPRAIDLTAHERRVIDQSLDSLQKATRLSIA